VVTLHQLRIFASVARQQSISKACAELHLSQPAISYQLKLLEEALEEKLYTKNNRGIELTEKGRLCLRHAGSILPQVEHLEHDFTTKLIRATPESLTVGGAYSPSAVLLPTLLALFQRAHPTVDLTLRTGNRRMIEDLVLKSKVEIALSTGPCRSPLMESEPYRREELVLFGPVGRSPVGNEALSLSEFQRCPLVIMRGSAGNSTAEQILKGLEGRGFKTSVVMRCDSSDALKTAVRKKVGLGILYRDVVHGEITKGDFQAIRVTGLKLEGRSYILYLKESPLSTYARDFLSLLHRWRKMPRG
jgi:DNA-binding transcriptional LysR family regulator